DEGVFRGGDGVGDDVGGRIDGDGDVGGLGDAAGGDRVGDQKSTGLDCSDGQGEYIAGCEGHGAVADEHRRVADCDRGAVDRGDLRAGLDTVGADTLSLHDALPICDEGVFRGGDGVGDDVGGRIDGDGDVGGLGDAAGGDRV